MRYVMHSGRAVYPQPVQSGLNPFFRAATFWPILHMTQCGQRQPVGPAGTVVR